MSNFFKTTNGLKSILESNDGVPFFDRPVNSIKRNGDRIREGEAKIVAAKNSAEKIFKEASIYGHANHEEAFAKLKAAGSKEQLIHSSIRDAVKGTGQQRAYMRNTDYEAAIANAFKPAPGNAFDNHSIGEFKAYIKLKHKASGYVGDGQAIENFFNENPLSTYDKYADAAQEIVRKNGHQTADFESDWVYKPKNNQKRDDNREREKTKNDDSEAEDRAKPKPAGSLIAMKMQNLRDREAGDTKPVAVTKPKAMHTPSDEEVNHVLNLGGSVIASRLNKIRARENAKGQ